jgi:type IX secretion system PorP/SprF family membrane protein
MEFRNFTIIIVLILAWNSLYSQDAFRYTFFDRTPLTLNPGLAGGFEGTVRIGAMLREQDFGMEPGQYQTPVLFADAPLIRGFRKYDWVGFGVSYQIDNQRVATNNLVQNTMSGGLSYHFSFDRKRKNVLTLGMQSGTASVFAKGTEFITGKSITDHIANPSSEIREELQNYLPIDVDKKSNSTGYTFGLVFTSNINERNVLVAGVSAGNIGRFIRYSILKQSAGDGRKNTKFVAFAKHRTILENGLILEPRFVFSYMAPSYEGSFQTLAGLDFKKIENTTLYAGLGYNFINGLQFLLAADYKEFRGFYSFDLNLSDKTVVSGPSGAMEIGLSYIIKVYRKPVPDPVLLCPRL